MKACVDCSCQRHAPVLIEGRWFLRCTACLRLSAPVGATVVNQEVFREAFARSFNEWAESGRKRRDTHHWDVVAIVAALIFAFLVAWNSGGAHGY